MHQERPRTPDRSSLRRARLGRLEDIGEGSSEPWGIVHGQMRGELRTAVLRERVERSDVSLESEPDD